MLVLSRREKERVKFPTLGITVEVIRTGTKRVQLGIDAPRQIRVIRAELDDQCDAACHPTYDISTETDMRKQLELASTAIHLAQNQMRQGLDSKADDALEQALLFLGQLEESFASVVDSDKARLEYVSESRASYWSGKRSLAKIIDDWMETHF